MHSRTDPQGWDSIPKLSASRCSEISLRAATGAKQRATPRRPAMLPPHGPHPRARDTHLPSWQSYSTMESSSLLEMTVSPLGLKSKQLILSEFSRNTLATRKLRRTLSVSFIPPGRAALRGGRAEGGRAGPPSGPGKARRAREGEARLSKEGPGGSARPAEDGERRRAKRGQGNAGSGGAGPAQAAARRLLLIVSAILGRRYRRGGEARGACWGGARAKPHGSGEGARRSDRHFEGGGGRD